MVHQTGAPQPQLQLDGVLEWVELLHGESPGKINIVSSADWRGRAFDIRDDVDSALQYVAELDARNVQGIYLRCTTIAEMPREGRGSARDSLAMPGLWADIDRAGPGHKDARDLPVDFAQAKAIVDMAQLPVPSYWVESGGGWYAWWVLQNPSVIEGDLERLTDFSRDWHRVLSWGAELAGCRYPTGTHDLARVLRIPGTVNRKLPEEPRACYLGRVASTGILYDAQTLEDHLKPALSKLEAAKPAPVVVDMKSKVERTGVSPLDAFEEQTDWAEILEPAGWTFSHQWGRERFWVRPGKNPRDGHSATTGLDPDRDRLYVFSTEAYPFNADETYTKAWAYGLLNHVSRDELPKHLRKKGYGDPWQEPVRVEDWASGPTERGGNPTPAPKHPAILDDDFWGSRTSLKHIREAAHASMLSAEAVLGVVLSRVAAWSSHRLRIPRIVGPRSSLTAFSVLVGASGDGKSSSCGIAADLIRTPSRQDKFGNELFADQLPVGTGEGIAEAYYGAVEVEDGFAKNGDPKYAVKRTVVRHNAFFFMDEGQALAQLSRRTGSTVMPTLRSAFSGATLGAMNASEERRRIVPGDKYAMGFVMGLQEALAASLLDDADGGTPQRCIWWRSTDPTVPDLDYLPDWPGELNWQPPEIPVVGDWLVAGSEDPYDLNFHPDIVREVRQRRLQVVRGEVQLDPLDSHLMLVRLKVAALLAILDERLDVNMDDWALSGKIMENSNSIRTRVIGTLEKVKIDKAQKATAAKLADSLAIEDGRERAMTKKAMERITRKLAEDGPTIRKVIQSFLSSAQREFLDEALDALIANGRVEEKL